MIDTTGSKPVERLAHCHVEHLGGISLVGLAALRSEPGKETHEAMRIVSFPCSQGCGAIIEGPQFFAPLTACDECVTKRKDADRWDKVKAEWLKLCPAAFRTTDTTHPGFPTAQHVATRKWLGDESLFFFGPTGRGKSRLAMLLLKRCLIHGVSVGVMWPEQLHEMKTANPRVSEWLKRWDAPDVLMMDDPLSVAAADSRTTEALKLLIDQRLRDEKRTIVTSQIAGDDYTDQTEKFGKSTKADKELVKALLRRLRETYRVVSFANPTPQQGEQAF